MGGVPCIRDLRIAVTTVVRMVADGMTASDVLAAYPHLERGDIQGGYSTRLTRCATVSCRWTAPRVSR
jgi:uncharacterized protein (DUF433 family)